MTIDPHHVKAEDVGGLRWCLRDGQTGLGKHGIIQKSATESSTPGLGGKAYYLAPTHTASLPLQFDANATSPRSDQLKKVVYLQLVVQDGFSKDRFVEQQLTVHTPKAYMIDEDHIYWHVENYPSAGFKGRVYLEPKNVSFAKILWREGEGTASAFAMSSPGQPGGYFIYDHEKKHLKTGRDLRGGEKEKRTVGPGNAAKGCKVEQIDSIRTGFNRCYPHRYSPYKGTYSGKGANNVDTRAPSVLSWLISWQYCRVDSGRGFGTPSWIEFQKAEHRAEMDGTGKVTISKAGASKAFDSDDATVLWPED